MTNVPAPAYPAATGNAFTDTAARAEHFTQLTAYFAKNPAATEPDSATRVTVAPSAPTAAPQLPAVPPGRTAEVRASGLQRGDTAPAGDVDQRALAYLTDLRRTTPAAQQTSTWKATWEADYADILAGRRMYESKQAFAARVAVAKPQAAPAAAADDGEVVGVTSEGFTAEQLQGYQLPAGIEFDRDMTVALLKIARTAGVPQRFVDAYIRNN